MMTFRTPLKIAFASLTVVFLLLAQSGGQGPLIFQNGGTPIGAGAILNCSTNLTCANTAGVINMTAAAPTGPTGPTGATGATGATGTAGATGATGTVQAPSTIESLPSCTTTAFYVQITDSAYSTAYCNGSSTYSFFLNGQQVTPPTGTFAWTNQGSASVTMQTNGLWTFTFPTHGATTNSLNLYLTTTPAVPFTDVYRFTVIGGQANCCNVGVALQESSTGKLIVALFQPAGDTGDCGTNQTPCIQVYTVSSPTGTFTLKGTSLGLGFRGAPAYPITIQVSVASGAAGNITINYATDDTGVNYSQIYQAAKNTFFTTAPDHIGAVGNNNLNGAANIVMSLLGIQ